MGLAEMRCRIKYEKLKFEARMQSFQFSKDYAVALASLRKDLNETDVAQFFPKKTTAKSTISSIRRKFLGDKSTRVKKAKDLVLSADMKYITMNGEEQLFVQYDNECKLGNRILIFYSDRATDILKMSIFWCIDGTFKYSPEIFYQILTITAMYKGNKFFPNCFISFYYIYFLN